MSDTTLGSFVVEPTMFCDGSETLCEHTHPKGGDPTEWPADLQVRQFPSVAAAAMEGRPTLAPRASRLAPSPDV